MRFYQASSFLFPGSYRLRIFTICFVATHLPLLSLIGWELWTGQAHWTSTIVVLLATLAGTGFALAAIHALLVPLHVASDALSQLESGQRVERLPAGGRDVIGRLLASVNRAAQATDRLVRSLDDRANTDPLTGLRNRRGFLQAVAQRRLDKGAAVALIDLDHFKRVNDAMGHSEGDRVLTAFAAALEAGLRRHDLCGRWGGEEFVVLFADVDVAEAMLILDRLTFQMECNPIGLLDGAPITFSAGVANFNDPALEDAILRADRALYAAKSQGRNCVRSDRV